MRATLRVTAAAVFLLAATAAAYACDTALLVIDVQDLYLSWRDWITADETDIVDAVRAALVAARAADVPVIYIQDFSIPDSVELYGDLMDFADRIAPRADEPVFSKETGNAFTNELLGAYLAEQGITRLLFTGLATDGCVEATLFSAFNQEYETIVLENAHAASTGIAYTAQSRNRFWVSLGITVIPMTEIDWAQYACSEDE